MTMDTAELVAGPQQERLNTLSNLVAKEIGGSVTDVKIKRIIQASNVSGILFHGIRKNSWAETATIEGVKPLTPESTADGPSGLTSYWSTGGYLFGGLRSDGNLETLDSTFFNWSHASDGEAYLNIAVTDKEKVNSISPVMIKPNSAVEVPFTVPPSDITLLRVQVDPSDMVQGARYAYRVAEQKMVGLLEKVIDGEYKPGEVVKLQLAKAAA